MRNEREEDCSIPYRGTMLGCPPDGASMLARRGQESEGKLYDGEEQFQQIIQRMPSPMVICNVEGTASIVNPAFLAAFGIPAAELFVERFNVFSDPLAQKLGILPDIKKVQQGETVLLPELRTPLAEIAPQYRVTRKEVVCHEVTIFPVILAGKVAKLVGIFKEITECRQTESKVHEYQQRLQGLSQRLVEGQEAERRRIARELHDELGQALTAVQLNLQALIQEQQQNGVPPLLNESLAGIEQLVDTIQGLTLGLRPIMLDDLGLVPTLRWLGRHQAERAKLNVVFQIAAGQARPDPAAETACFRIAQEALTNVVKHAKAHSVVIALSQEAQLVHLCVQDDGIGFDLAAARKRAATAGNLGLIGMAERVSLLGGRFECNSAPGFGTAVHAWLPLHPSPILP